MMRHHALGLALFTCFWLCSGSIAAKPGEPFRPLIFVPGILGTELLDDNNHIVWGDVRSLNRFEDLEITEHGPAKALHVGRVVRSINVLGPLWTIHQYDGLLRTLTSQDVGFEEGKTLFIFPYDWRNSNVDSAMKLRDFIENEPKLKGREFDILAHSMGGIVGKIYIENFGGAFRVKRFISMGVPFRGSMNALAQLTEGWGAFENRLAGGIQTIRRVLFSFPSLYELFPSYEDCCRIGNEDSYATFRSTDFGAWKANATDWLPPERVEGGLAALEANLGRAKEVQAVLRRSMPQGIGHIVIAGDRFATKYYLYIDPANRTWKKWRFSTSRGDGTVPVWSAANSDELDGTLPAFVDHATIFDDEWVTSKLRREFNRNAGPPPVASANTPTVRKSGSGLVDLDLIKVETDPSSIVASGANVHISLTVQAHGVIRRGELVPDVSIEKDGMPEAVSLQDVSTDADVESRTLRFLGTFRAKIAGAYALRIGMPGFGGRYTKDLLVLE